MKKQLRKALVKQKEILKNRLVDIEAQIKEIDEEEEWLINTLSVSIEK